MHGFGFWDWIGSFFGAITGMVIYFLVPLVAGLLFLAWLSGPQ